MICQLMGQTNRQTERHITQRHTVLHTYQTDRTSHHMLHIYHVYKEQSHFEQERSYYQSSLFFFLNRKEQYRPHMPCHTKVKRGKFFKLSSLRACSVIIQLNYIAFTYSSRPVLQMQTINHDSNLPSKARPKFTSYLCNDKNVCEEVQYVSRRR